MKHKEILQNILLSLESCILHIPSFTKVYQGLFRMFVRSVENGAVKKKIISNWQRYTITIKYATGSGWLVTCHESINKNG